MFHLRPDRRAEMHGPRFQPRTGVYLLYQSFPTYPSNRVENGIIYGDRMMSSCQEIYNYFCNLERTALDITKIRNIKWHIFKQ